MMFTGAMTPNWLMRRTEISGNAKLCLARLYQFAGKDGICFPRITTIAKEVGLSTRTVQRCLRELEDLGLIDRGERLDKSGRTISPSYLFPMHEWQVAEVRGVKLSPQGDKTDAKGCQAVAPGGDKTDTPYNKELRESDLRESEEENCPPESENLEVKPDGPLAPREDIADLKKRANRLYERKCIEKAEWEKMNYRFSQPITEEICKNITEHFDYLESVRY